MESYPVQSSPPLAEDDIDQVISLYANRIFRIAFSRLKNKSDAEDIVQEVFLKYIANQDKFTEEEYRKAWLIRVTINCSNSLLRSAWFKKTTELKEDIPTTMEESSDLIHYVLKLPEKYRTVIHLFYYEELSVKEISSILGITESLVKTRLHRARNELKKLCPDPTLF